MLVVEVTFKMVFLVQEFSALRDRGTRVRRSVSLVYLSHFGALPVIVGVDSKAIIISSEIRHRARCVQLLALTKFLYTNIINVSKQGFI